MSRALSVCKNMPLKCHTSYQIPFHCPKLGHMASHIEDAGKDHLQLETIFPDKIHKKEKERMANRRLFSTSATGDKWEEAGGFQFTNFVCVF